MLLNCLKGRKRHVMFSLGGNYLRLYNWDLDDWSTYDEYKTKFLIYFWYNAPILFLNRFHSNKCPVRQGTILIPINLFFNFYIHFPQSFPNIKSLTFFFCRPQGARKKRKEQMGKKIFTHIRITLFKKVCIRPWKIKSNLCRNGLYFGGY